MNYCHIMNYCLSLIPRLPRLGTQTLKLCRRGNMFAFQESLQGTRLLLPITTFSSLIPRPLAFHHHFKYNPPFIILVLVTLEKWLGAWKWSHDEFNHKFTNEKGQGSIGFVMKQHISISSVVNGEGDPSLPGSENCRSNSRGYLQCDKCKLHPLSSQCLHEPYWQINNDISTSQIMFQPIGWWYLNQPDDISTNQPIRWWYLN